MPIILLTLNFIWRFINFAKILSVFPLDTVNDLTAYIPDIIFFSKYGFFGHVPLWYNGFTLFNIYPPGWVFFTFPIYKVLGNIMLAVFISTIVLFLLALLGTWLIGKELGISKLKRIALFLFIFANPMMIGAILKQGRIPSLMALVLLTYLFYICIYFRERKFNWKAILIPFILAGLILTHQTETVLGAAFILGLFLIKNNAEKIKLILLMLVSILFSSFWLFHFLKATQETGFLQFGFSQWLTNWHSYFWNNLAGVFIGIALIITFSIFYLQRKDKSWLYFFLPILILDFLYLTRLTLFVPIIKYIYPDPWQDFLILNLSITFLGIQYQNIKKNWKTILTIGLILVALASVTYNLKKTPYIKDWNQEGKEAITLLPILDPDSHFLMFNEASQETYSRAIYSYAAIYYNVSSASGWFEVNKEYSYIEKINSVYSDFYTNENCDALETLNKEFNTNEILANGHYCRAVETCGWKRKATEGSSCILSHISN